MQLSEDPRLMLPPGFRVEYNKWMAEFFGYTSIVKDGEVYKFGNTLIMNQTTYEAIKLAIPHVSNI